MLHGRGIDLRRAPPDSAKQLELQPHLAMPVQLDAAERFLLRVFLRRYITHCARRRRFAQMRGAARLFSEVSAA